MRSIVISLCSLLLAAAAPPSDPHWSRPQLERLIEWLSAAEHDGLGIVSIDAPKLRSMLGQGDSVAVDRAATAAAIRLLRAHRDGCCNAALRKGWHIEAGRAWPDPARAVAEAVARNRIDALFGTARPSHPFYYSLRRAYGRESNITRRTTLAANLDRWRWMPRDPGSRYLLVNSAAFEATMWEGRSLVGRWSIIVGKTKSPTPIFQASVTGVTFNPWWEIPASIAAEGIARQMMLNPGEMARKGYVREGGRYRQRPGPNNALGRMKLVMPNRFSVYLHDTPAQALFAREVRTYSHGCVRVGDALGLASAILDREPGWTRARADQLVAMGVTRTIMLDTPLPVYVAYFTAEPDGQGGIRYFPDVYNRDGGASIADADGRCI